MSWQKLSQVPGQKVHSFKYNITYWKIESGHVWHQERKLKSADTESFEVQTKEDQRFIARDKSSIYHGWNRLPKIDRNTFMEIGSGYWKDEKNAYFEYETSIKPLKGNDIENFKYLGGGYAFDSQFAYYWGRAIKSCNDPMSLQPIGDHSFYAHDRDNIYYDGTALKGTDIQSWKLLENGYSKDDKSIFFGSAKLPGAKIDSWRRYEESYSMDEKNVFVMHLRLKGADPNSWKLLGNGYSKDTNSVFYVSNIIADADPNSFEVMAENTARDKHGVFSRNIRKP